MGSSISVSTHKEVTVAQKYDEGKGLSSARNPI